MEEILVFDKEAALERVEGDMELFAELVGILMEEYPTQLAGIKEAVDRGDCYAINRSAHALKSALGNLGGMKAYSAALALEMAGKQEQLADVRGLYSDLKIKVQEFVAVTRDFLAET